MSFSYSARSSAVTSSKALTAADGGEVDVRDAGCAPTRPDGRLVASVVGERGPGPASRTP